MPRRSLALCSAHKSESTEAGIDTKYDGRVTIIPMTYATFVKRAEKRMLGLRDKLKDVPFLRTQGLDAEAFLTPQHPRQAVLFGDAAQTGR